MVCYDFSSDKTRSKFSKFLSQYGHRVQYSVFAIRNSDRVMENILTEIEDKYEKYMKNTDHVLIFPICEACRKKIIRYGSASHEVEDVVYL